MTKNTSQSQNNVAEVVGAEWRKAAEEGTQRFISWMSGMVEDAAKAERAMLEQTDRSLAEGARLWRESAEYATRLATEWRAHAVEAGKRAASVVFPPHV
jgi:hypothetical protein